jgi:hypothetical protein
VTVLAALALALLVIAVPRATAEPCKITWQASSIEVVDGVQSTPVVTSNCNPEGKP